MHRLLLRVLLPIFAASVVHTTGFSPVTNLRWATTCTRTVVGSTCNICLFAKKKKKKGKKQPKQKGGFEWASSFKIQPTESKSTRELASTAVASFKGRAGEDLSSDLDGAPDIPKALWNAPVACVVVGEGDDAGETVVTYANIAALEACGLKPDEFDQLISTPAPQNSEASSSLITLNLPSSMKGDKKFERGYSKKMLIREDGGPVQILNAYRWQLEKSTIVDGKFVTTSSGVAYAWSEWTVGETILCRPGGIQEVIEDLGDLDERIATQAAFVRDLKENQGLANKDPQVVDAVAELIRLKNLQES